MKYYMIVYQPFGFLNTAFIADSIDEKIIDNKSEFQDIFNRTWNEGSFENADTLEGSWDYIIIHASSEEEAFKEFLKLKNEEFISTTKK